MQPSLQIGMGIGQAQALAYEFFFKPEPGLWLFIGLFFWPGLTYLKAWPGLQAYLQAYFILIY